MKSYSSTSERYVRAYEYTLESERGYLRILIRTTRGERGGRRGIVGGLCSFAIPEISFEVAVAHFIFIFFLRVTFFC